MRIFVLFISFWCIQIATAQYSIELLDSNTFTLGQGVVLSKTSFRGLSVVDDNTIWVSGSKGTISRSIDGGKTFTYNQLKGYEKSDFRDIEAFDDKRAIIMSSGTPAYILKTTDGGQTWKEVYKNTDTAYFLDAMDFWDDKRGILVGDPINGHFVLLQTEDGGETWQQLDTTKTPKAMEGEAVFAASGTSLRCWKKNEFGFVTGGKETRFIFTLSKKKYDFITPPMIHGEPSQGAFSFAVWKDFIAIIGGDYKIDTITRGNLFTSYNYPKKYIDELWGWGWNNPMGYQSSIEIINENKDESHQPFISSGTNGTHSCYFICGFAGCAWHYNKIGGPFNVVRKAKKGKAVFLAGDKGRIAKLIY